ncbi:MAG TPA: hypothetical protein VFC78_09620 [Tepidisphaeraceae bacterium]|nr:hypothetical protein [Tepidisphaeraceae bacterium]
MRNVHFPSRLGIAILLCVAASLCFTLPAKAQSGPGLLAKPWPQTDDALDGRADAYFFGSGHVKDYNDSFRLDAYQSEGRFRLIPGNEISPRIGYDFLFLDSHTDAPHLNRQLTDASISLGSGVAKWDTWVAGVSVGLGYAGNNAFGEGKGWYGKADVIVADQLNKDDYLAFIIDYDGHRTFMPDTPIPGIGFSHRFDPTLQAVVGLPYDSLSWKPGDRWDIEGEYYLLSDLHLSAAYNVVDHWWAYGSFDTLLDAFRVSELRGNRRLLFSQRRVEMGVRYSPCDRLTFKLGAGYGFNGGFRNGWDYRGANSLIDFSDVPYIHGGLELRF